MCKNLAVPYFLEINIDCEPEPPTHQTDQKCSLSSLRVLLIRLPDGDYDNVLSETQKGPWGHVTGSGSMRHPS